MPRYVPGRRPVYKIRYKVGGEVRMHEETDIASLLRELDGDLRDADKGEVKIKLVHKRAAAPERQ